MNNKLIYTLLWTILPLSFFAQTEIRISDIMGEKPEGISGNKSETAFADIDNDGRIDSLYYDYQEEMLLFFLSSQNVQPLIVPFEIIPCYSYINVYNGGFTCINNCMRANNSESYIYDKKNGKFRWTGFSVDYYGNAANDGSGWESFDLMTGEYTASLSAFNYDLFYLFLIPEFTKKYEVLPIYLNDTIIELPPYDTLFTFYKNNFFEEYIKNPQTYDAFKNLFKQITPGVDSIYIELQDAIEISKNSPFNIYQEIDDYKTIISQTYLPGDKDLDIFIVFVYEMTDDGMNKSTELWTFKNGKFADNHSVDYGFENERGSCNQSFIFNTDTTFTIHYHNTASPYASELYMPFTEKYQVKFTINENGEIEQKEFFNIEYSSPYFHPCKSDIWKQKDNYMQYPDKEEPYCFQALENMLKGYFYVRELENGAFSTTFFTRDPEGNIIAELTISPESKKPVIHKKANKNMMKKIQYAKIETATIKTCMGDVYLRSDGNFGFSK